MNVAIIYFSPTGSTARIAKEVHDTLKETAVDVEEHDITSYSDRQKIIDLKNYNAIVFGFPIYYWRAPRVIRNWLKSIKGEGKKCATFFTYGGVNIGAAHYNMKTILNQQDFFLVASAEFICSHTYNLAGWDIFKNRPNHEDYEIAREFALKILQKFTTNAPEVEITNPDIKEEQLDTMETAMKRATSTPFRDVEHCSMCRTCETSCPVHAMNAEKGKPNRKLCIRCLRCLANCPDKVITIDDMSARFQYIKKITHLNDEKLRTLKSKIYL